MADEYLGGAEPLTDIDGVGLLCDRCYDLEEPPWYPNNRQRCSIWIREMLFRHIMANRDLDGVAARVAVYLAENVP